MKEPYEGGEWRYCDAETYAGDPCAKKARVHYVKVTGICVKHFCAQHAKMYGPGVAFDHVERYVT